jgi:hypothetical protein
VGEIVSGKEAALKKATEENRYRMLSLARSLAMRSLNHGGEKDLQCDPQDIFRIAEVSPAASETLLVRNMNHLLRIETDKSSLIIS